MDGLAVWAVTMRHPTNIINPIVTNLKFMKFDPSVSFAVGLCSAFQGIAYSAKSLWAGNSFDFSRTDFVAAAFGLAEPKLLNATSCCGMYILDQKVLEDGTRLGL